MNGHYSAMIISGKNIPTVIRVTVVSSLRIVVLFSLMLFHASVTAAGSEAEQSDTTEAEVQETGLPDEQTSEEETTEPKPWYKNFVPIPVIITEPAIGEGLGLGIGYFHPAKTGDAYQPKKIESSGVTRDISIARKPPPTVTGAFGAVTSNGTYAGGVSVTV